jgi:predicted enzyme related to lactoylglutathione lyase
MISSPLRLSVLRLASLLLVGVATSDPSAMDRGQTNVESRNPVAKQVQETALKVQYLEIVTPSVNETCEVLALAHGVVFSDPIAELGNARTADLEDGGRIGVRAPMRDTEEPVVRPYVLVDDIEAAVTAAEANGGKVALPPMEIPGHGTFSIYILGGIEHGLWQL